MSLPRLAGTRLHGDLLPACQWEHRFLFSFPFTGRTRGYWRRRTPRSSRHPCEFLENIAVYMWELLTLCMSGYHHLQAILRVPRSQTSLVILVKDAPHSQKISGIYVQSHKLPTVLPTAQGCRPEETARDLNPSDKP